MIRYFFICLAFLVLAAIVQQWVPSFGGTLYNSRILLVPLVFFCIAHAMGYTATLIFAIIAGFLWDAENVLAPYYDTTDGESQTVDNLKFGYSIFLFGIIGFLIKFLQAALTHRGLLLYVTSVLLSFIIYLLLENLIIFFVRGTGTADHRFLYQIAYTAIFSTLLSPLLFIILGLIWKALKCSKRGVAEGMNVLIQRRF